MKIYSEFIFPRIYNFALRHKAFDQARANTLQEAKGKILEIGIGTGLNLDYYPSKVSEISAIEPSLGMQKKLRAKSKGHRIQVHTKLCSAEKLEFEDESFDTLVSTLTFCTIEDLDQALQEMKRVMKADAKLLFLEHGLSPSPQISRWQHRLNPVQKRIGCGCSLTVNTREALLNAGFQILKLQNYYLENVPKYVGYVYEGIAHK